MSGTGEHRTVYLSDLGYVVYRHSFDEARCSVAEGARAHKVAVFVEERAALDYCAYRNRLTAERGTDAL